MLPLVVIAITIDRHSTLKCVKQQFSYTLKYTFIAGSETEFKRPHAEAIF